MAVQVSDGGRLPQLLCEACLAALPVDGVGMALMTAEGPAALVGATSGGARTMEDLQLVMGEGPCVDASTQGRPVLQPQLRLTAPTRWLGFGPAALHAGIEAMFAFPLQVGQIGLGVLDLYRTSAGDLSESELGEALSFADAAVAILLHLQDQAPLDSDLHPDLGEPMHRQAEIHQATGMIAVQADVELTGALLLLRARAYSSGRSITDLAAEVVARTLRFDP